MQPWIWEFIEWIKREYAFLLILALSVSLSYFVREIQDYNSKLIFLGLILILFVSIYLLNRYKNFTQMLNKYNTLGMIPSDISILHVHKKVVFDDKSLTLSKYSDTNPPIELHDCKVTTKRVIFNHMPSIYSNYSAEFFSDIYVPKENTAINVKKDGVDKEVEIDYCVHHGPNNEIIRLTSKITSKIELNPGSACELEMNYRTPAFHEAIMGKPDVTTYYVSTLTEKITFEIKLASQFKAQYMIKKIGIPDIANKKLLDYTITDYSDQRMFEAEDDLSNMNCVPQFQDDNLYWIIYRPKIGYSYNLHFKCVKK